MGSSVERFLQETGGVRKPTPGPTTLTGQFLDDEDEKRKLRAAAALDRTEPEAAARILNMEARTGLPHDLIERNLDQIEAAVNLPGFDAEAFKLKSPLVASWLAQHPKHLSLAGEDLTKLNWLERQFRNVKNQFKAGAATNELEDIGTKAMLGRETKADRKRQAELEQQMGLYSTSAEDLGLTGGLNEVPGAVAQQLPIFAKTASAGALGALVGGAVGRGPGAKLGWRIASGVEAGRMEASLAYLDFEKLKDDRGQPLGRNTALGAAIVTGIINGSFEMMGFENLAENTPGLRALTKDGIKKALTKATTGRALRSYLEHIGESAATEGFTEFMQELVTSTSGEFSKMIQDGSISTLSPGELLGRIFSGDHLAAAFESGKQGAFAGGGMTSITSGITIPSDVARAKRAQAAYKVMNDLGTTAKASAMMEHMPGKMQEVVEHLAADGPVENLYAPIGVWNEYWQSQKLDPEKVATEVLGPNGAALYQEAVDTGGDLTIPTGAYAAKLAATDHHGGLIAKLRSGPNELSAEEAQEAVRAMDAESEAIKAEAHDERKAEIEEVMGDIQSQLEATGYDEHTSSTLAQMYRHIFNMTSESPRSVFEKFGLSISRPALEQAQNNRQERVLNQSAWERVKDQFKDWTGVIAHGVNDERFRDRSQAIKGVTGSLFELWDRFQDDKVKVMVGDDMLRAFRGGTTRAMSYLRTLSQGLDNERLSEKQIEAIVMNEPWVLASETLKEARGKTVEDRDTAMFWRMERLEDTMLHRTPEQYHDRIRGTIRDARTEAKQMLRGVDETGILPESDQDLDRDVNRRMGREFYQDKVPDSAYEIDPDTVVPEKVATRVMDYITDEQSTDDDAITALAQAASNNGDMTWRMLEDFFYTKEGEWRRGIFKNLPDLKQWLDSKKFKPEGTSITQMLEGFHSKAERTIEQKMGGRASVSEVRALLKDVKDEEKRWTGINEFLDGLPPDAKVTKEAVLKALQTGRINLKEVDRNFEQQGMSDYDVDAVLESVAEDLGTDARSFVMNFVDLEQVDTNEGKMWFAHVNNFWNDDDTNFRLQDYYGFINPSAVRHYAEMFGNESHGDLMLKDTETNTTIEAPMGIFVPGSKDANMTQRHASELLMNHMVEDLENTDEPYGSIVNAATEAEENNDDNDDNGYDNYSTYTLDGGSNYRELVFTLPDVRGAFNEGHEFGIENIVFHVRIKDREDVSGGKMLFIEEVQSDWHQAGRERGYRDEKGIEKAQKVQDELIAHRTEMFKELDILNFLENLTPAQVDRAKELDKELKALQEEIDLAAAGVVQQMGGRRAVPDAPFRSTWHEIAMKRMIRIAAEGGYDSIGWTTGDQQANRWNMSRHVDEVEWEQEILPKVLDLTHEQRQAMTRMSHLEMMREEGVPMTTNQIIDLDRLQMEFRDVVDSKNMTKSNPQPTGRVTLRGNKFVTQWHLKPDMEHTEEEVDKFERLTDRLDVSEPHSKADEEWLRTVAVPTVHKNTQRQQTIEAGDMFDWVGKEMSAKIKAAIEAGETKGSFSGEDLKIGGHGHREFYDRMIPGFVKKFVNKYGAKVGQTQFIDDRDFPVPHKDIAARLGRNPTQEEFDAAQKGVKGPTVHHMALTPELKRAALDDEFVLYQDWQHRSVRAKWAGNVNEINGTQMKWLPLLEFLNDYGLDPDRLDDIELIINKNPRPKEGKYRTTIMLKSRKVDAALWRQMIEDAKNDPTGQAIFKLVSAPMTEETIPIGHIAHDDPKEMERFVEDLQFKPTEYRQSRSEVVRNARNELVGALDEITGNVDVEPDFSSIKADWPMSRKELDQLFKSNIEGNFHQDGDLWQKLDSIIVDDRYDMDDRARASFMVDDITGEGHDWLGLSNAERVRRHVAVLAENFQTKETERDVKGLTVLKDLRSALNHGKPSEVKHLLIKLDMVNEVMRTALKELAPSVDKWANMPDNLDQETDDEPRGRIRIGASSIDIELLKNADLSTFIHESAHFFLEVMSELAPDNEAVAKDLGTIKNWLGMKPDESFGREQHELFARGFEKYIGEGKAPVPELQTAFARFKAWLSMTYRTLADLNVELTDEVRGVFDRLLASDEEIEKARKEQFQQPLFADPKAVGMTEAEAKSYNEDVQKARLAAEESLTAQIMQEFEREKSRVWNAEKIKVRAEVGQEANENLVMRTFSLLRTGRLPNGEELEGFQPFKLDKADVQNQYKVDVPEALLATTGGKTRTMSPANAAAYFGFSSPEEMLNELAKSPDPKNWIEKKTNERMRSRRYEGTPLKSAEIEVEAKRAIHNEQRAKLMQRELQVLAAQNLPTLKGLVRRMSRRLPKLAEVTAEAKRIVESKQIKDIRPDVYLRAEAEYAKKAMEALLKGDFNLAFEHKQRELLNHELYAQAADARKAVTTGVKFMNKFNKDKIRRILGKAGGQYLAQIDALMDRFDFRQNVSNVQVEKKQSLREFLDEQSSLGLQPNVPPEVINEAYRKHYKELTYAEFVGVVESTKLIQHLATLKNRLLASSREKTIGKAVTAMTTKMAENFDITKEEPIDLAAGLRTRIKRGVKGIIASHTKMEFLFEWLDGNTNHGPVWGYLFEPFARAESDENARMKVAAKGIREIFEVYPKSERATWFWRKTRVAAVDMDFTKGNALAVALNWGNEGNRQALMEGYGWSEKQVEAVLDTLDARDWATVQKVWDYLEGFWPDIEKLEKDLNGIAPEKVEATPIVNKHGSFRGGYYPIVFDEQLSWKQALLNQQADVTQLFGGQWAQVMTRNGHTKQRTGSGGKPIKLSLTSLTQHVTNVVHDLTHRRAVVDVTRLSQRPEIRQAIENAAGRDMYKQIHPWIVNIARGQQSDFFNPIEDLLSRGRVGATVVNMGWKASTAVVQILSYTNTVKEIGAKYSALGVSDVWSKPWKLRESWDFITSRSPFMEHRIANYDRDVRDALQTLNVAGVKSGPLSFLGAYTGPIRNSFFQFIGMMDMAVSMPTWMGAYRKAMDGEAVGIDKGHEDAAIQYADKIVRETQGVGAAKDMAAVQRGSEAYKIFAMFYSYFSVLFNQFAKTQRQLSLDKNLPKYIASIALLWFVPAALQELMVGRGPDDDDDDSWLKWLAKTEGKYPFQSVIILRDIINGMDRFGYEPSAALDMFGAISDALKASGKVFTDEEFTRAEAKNAAMAAGYITQLPSRQLWLTSEYLFDWLTGTEEPENPIEAGWRGIITGGKKK